MIDREGKMSDFNIIDHIPESSDPKEQQAIAVFRQLLEMMLKDEQASGVLTPEVDQLFLSLDLECLAKQIFPALSELANYIAGSLAKDFSEKIYNWAVEFSKQTSYLRQTFQIFDFVRKGMPLVGHGVRIPVAQLDRALEILDYQKTRYLAVQKQLETLQNIPKNSVNKLIFN